MVAGLAALLSMASIRLLTVEDAAGAAELLEVIGEQRDEGGSIALTVGVEQTFFESVEMVLELGGVHKMTLIVIRTTRRRVSDVR